mgnify:CR=1 FL=1
MSKISDNKNIQRFEYTVIAYSEINEEKRYATKPGKDDLLFNAANTIESDICWIGFVQVEPVC